MSNIVNIRDKYLTGGRKNVGEFLGGNSTINNIKRRN